MSGLVWDMFVLVSSVRCQWMNEWISQWMGWHQGHGFALQAKAMAKTNPDRKLVRSPFHAPSSPGQKGRQTVGSYVACGGSLGDIFIPTCTVRASQFLSKTSKHPSWEFILCLLVHWSATKKIQHEYEFTIGITIVNAPKNRISSKRHFLIVLVQIWDHFSIEIWQKCLF